MRVWRREEDFDLPSCVVALGTFDGVHIGHQALIRRAMALAQALDTACVVYTFRNHPLSVLCPERAPEALLQADEKLSKLSAMGVDGVDAMTLEEARKAAVDAVKQLSQDVGIPANLKEIVKKEDLDFLAQSAYDDACRPGNPRETSVAEIKALYESLL